MLRALGEPAVALAKTRWAAITHLDPWRVGGIVRAALVLTSSGAAGESLAR